MMRNIIVAFFIQVIWCGMVMAQPWEYHYSKKIEALKSTSINDNLKQNELNFFEKQEAFNRYWKGRIIEKGKGFKQFKRWEYFMEMRVDELGKIDNSAYWDALNIRMQQKQSNVTPVWSKLGPINTPYTIGTTNIRGNGRLNTIAFHPTDKTKLYVGAPSGGFWRSSDGGANWITTTDMLGSIGISDIVVHPDNPDVIYVATGDGDAGDTYGIGILKSTDGGTTWLTTSVSNVQSEVVYFRRMLMNPHAPDTMIAAAKNGIYRTTDGWVTHTVVKTGHYKDLEFKPGDPSVVYASRYGYSGTGRTYKSIDGGVNWNADTTGMKLAGTVNRIELAVTPDNPNVVYAVASNSADDGFYALYKSTDSGDSWTSVYDGNLNLLGWSSKGTDSGGQGWYDLALAVSPNDENIIFVGGVNVWKSNDAGASWELSSHWFHKDGLEYMHADHHFMAYSPVDNSLYSANDGGLFVSANDGENWKSISNGLEISQIYKLGVAQQYPGRIICGLQDNGTMLTSAGEWSAVIGGDGMECLIDYTDSDIMYGELYNGEIRRSMDRGNRFVDISPTDDPSGAWVTPFAIHPENPHMLIIGYHDIYKTTDRGDNWEVLEDNLTTAVTESDFTLRTIVIPKANSSYIYAASRYNIWKSVDDGENWTNITNGLPTKTISSIAVADDDVNRMWVSLTGYSTDKKVYYSKDGGDTWENYSTGLPNIPALSIVYRSNSNDELYLGTDVGVYYRDATMDSWLDFNNGLPNVVIGELEISEQTNVLYAATYGRGLWNTQLPKVTKTIPSFTADVKKACEGTPVSFHINSTFSYDSITWNVDGGTIFRDYGDTLIVKFQTTGYKTIGLTYYKDGIDSVITKDDYIHVDNSIDFVILPSDTIIGCQGNTVTIQTLGNYDYSWSPSANLSSESGDSVVLDLQSNQDIEITATSGVCVTKKTISVVVGPSAPDNIENAELLGIGKYGPYSNVYATKQLNEPKAPGLDCENQISWCSGESSIQNSLWFKVPVPQNGGLKITTGGMDTQIALYKANSITDLFTENYTLIAANDDYPEREDYSALIEDANGLNFGDTLWLQVDGSFGGATGTFEITVEKTPYVSGLERVNKEIIQDKIMVIPNPNNGSFKLSKELSIPSVVSIEIYNMDGKLIEKRETNELVRFIDEDFDIQHSKGIHVVVINTKKERIYKKILVK